MTRPAAPWTLPPARPAEDRNLTALLLLASTALAGPPSSSSGELLARLERLRHPGRVLYVAAHPDDENTRLIAWLVGDRGLDVTYLSLTRGGGGQNLIGGEQSELLGVVRTGELLAARGIDGGSQRFTRARDFGYSKSAEESLAIWGHDEVLRDVVQVVREVRPDIVVTRFGPDDKSHGHHVASARLAGEAIALAADPTFVIPGTEPWAVSLAWRNESHWRIDDDTDTSAWHRVDVGTYDPMTGQSWGEVAARARTMHKSQGFGASPQVGEQLEYFTVLKGIPEAMASAAPPVSADPFGSLPTSWAHLPGGAAVDKALARAAKRFDPADPSASLDDLALVHGALSALDHPGAHAALVDVEAWMQAAVGLWVTARAKRAEVRPGGMVSVELVVLQRAPRPDSVSVPSLSLVLGAEPVTMKVTGAFDFQGPVADLSVFVAPHVPFAWSADLRVTDGEVTRPHWLREPPTAASYTIPEGPDRVAPDTAAPMQVRVDLEIAGVPMTVQRPVTYAVTDRVHGERVQAVHVLPPLTVTPSRSARLIPIGEAAELTVTVRAHGDGPAQGAVRFVPPAGVHVEPSEVSVALEGGAATDILLRVVPIEDGAAPDGPLRIEIDDAPAWRVDAVDHPHVARRPVLRPAEVRVVPVALDRGGVDRIAYVQGSGDTVDRALIDLGYEVQGFDPTALREALSTGGLEGYDAVVFGIRAFNTHPELLELLPGVEAWVADGHVALVQYNTSSRWTVLPPIGPGAVQIGRDRVTDETAPVAFVDPSDPVVTFPNVLTDADLDGWVQERGLYFATSWGDAARGVLELADPEEEPTTGALVVTPHGDGAFVYSGISWFRQLPPGVPGPARLLANVLALAADRDAE